MTSTAMLRPDATARIVTVSLTGGDYYKVDDLLLPAALKTLRFLRLIRNVAPESRHEVIRSASRTAMDAIMPSWRSVGPSYDIKNYLTDAEDNLGFYVFPAAPVPDAVANPPVTPAQVELMYSAIPAPIALPGEGKTWEDITGALTTETVFDTALVEYVLSRAFSKDAEYGGNGARAASHFGSYQQALGYESEGNVASKTHKRATS